MYERVLIPVAGSGRPESILPLVLEIVSPRSEKGTAGRRRDRALHVARAGSAN